MYFQFQCWFFALRVAAGSPFPLPVCGQEISGAGQTTRRVHLHQVPHLPRVHAKAKAEGGGREEVDQRDHQSDWEMVEGGQALGGLASTQHCPNWQPAGAPKGGPAAHLHGSFEGLGFQASGPDLRCSHRRLIGPL